MGEPARLGRWLDRWMKAVSAHPKVAIVGTLGAATVALYVAATTLGINTDTAEMLSPELPFRQMNTRYRELFPENRRDILVVVDASTPELADRAANALVARLSGETDVVAEAELPGGEDFFREYQLLYRDIDELETLETRLGEFEPFLAPVFDDPTPRGLVTAFADALLDSEADAGEDAAPSPEHLTRALREISAAVESYLEGDPYQISWVGVFDQSGAADRGRRRIVAVEPVLNHDQFLPAAAAIERIRSIADELETGGIQEIDIRITGPNALEHEELQSVSSSAALAGLLALGAVCVTLLVGLGSLWMTVATLVTLGAGLSLSAGFAALAVGDLNMISLAFAVLYIGLGVDYAIHFALRFRERVHRDVPAGQAVREGGADVGPALALCATTTALGFFAFVPTSYAGVAELGLISGTSMFIALFVSLTLLPALLQLGPLPRRPAPAPVWWRRRVAEPLAHLPARHGRTIRWTTLVLAAASAFLLSRAGFDINPNNLRNPASESVSTFDDLLADPNSAPWTVSVLTDSSGADGIAANLERLPTVSEVRALTDLVPADQSPKLQILARLATSFPDSAPPPAAISVENVDAQVQAVRDLRDLSSFASGRTDGDLGATLDLLSRRLRNLLFALRSRTPAQQAEFLDAFNRLLLDAWSTTMNDLFRSFRVTELTRASLPESIQRQWIAVDGTRRLQVFPKEDLSDPTAMRAFVDEIFTVTQSATDLPVIYVEAGREIVRAFRLAFLGALGAIFLVLLFVLRRPDSVLLVLLPLVLAALITGGTTVLLGMPFNFANIIVLPLLFGLGVDNGIHIFHRIRNLGTDGQPVLLTSTARGVVFSGITTVLSFSSLAFTPHRGIASMGMLLGIGVLLIQVFTLVVLPAFLEGDKDQMTA